MTASEISMVIPAHTRFISTARLTVASLAAEIDFTVDEIDELQMGANELIVLLVELAEDHGAAHVDLRFVVQDDALEVHGALPLGANVESPLDVMAEQILKAVVDDFEFDGATARLTKRRAQV